jgi:hypothetical protein
MEWIQSLSILFFLKTAVSLLWMDAGNVGNIFLIIIPALCKEKGSPFGAPDACLTYGLAYSSLSLAVRQLLFLKKKEMIITA